MKKISRIILFAFSFLTFMSDSYGQYCFPMTTRNPDYNNYNFYIDRVILADIDNQDSYTPADTSYNDYTLYGPMTNLTRGNAYNITVYTGPTVYYYNMFYAAWIDYNNDGDFSDAGENIFQHEVASSSEIITKSFTVPAGSSIAKTRLRIRCTYTTASPFNVDPCATYTYGESEDYTVGITDFLKVATTIPGAWDFDIEFFNIGDDSDYDIIMLDEWDDLVPVNFFSNNGSGSFTINNSFLGSVSPAFDEINMSFNLCDLNNDNRLDLLLTSRNNSTTPRTTYFQNNGSQLIQTATGMADLMWGSSAAADLNNDGRQDVIICGKDAASIPYTYIYMNTASGVILINDKLKGVYGEMAVADYDNDMDVDILLTGTDRYGNSNSILYRNDNNWLFTEIFTNIYKFTGQLKPQFVDFNHDGLLDLLCGKAYRNDGNGVFTETKAYAQYDIPYLVKGIDIDNDGITEILGQADFGAAVYNYDGTDSLIISQHLIGPGRENLDAADINGDKKADIIVNDSPAYIFSNQTASSNNIPGAPPDMASSIGDSGFYSVSLKWKPGSDDKTPVDALTYNLRVGTTSGGNQIFSSMTAPTTNNPLLKPGMGNVYTNKSWFLKDLPPGTYYWSVQTVDNSGLASAFSTEKTFTILKPLTLSSFLVNGRLYQAGAGSDLDGDNDMDLIIKDASLTIHRQTAPYAYTAVPLRATCDLLGISDLNNDNLPDIIVRHNKQTGELTDSLELFINLGSMSFTTIKIDSIFAGSVTTAAAADFDNDGDIDILVHSKGDILFENTGDMTFSRRKLNLTSSLFMASVSSIDLDRDGDADYIIAGKEDAGFMSSLSKTFAYENTGDLNFSLMQSITPAVGSTTFTIDAGATATNPADITWNDFNFDGYPDLLITGEDEYKNSLNQIFLNDGTGMLVATSLSPRPADRYSSTWIDFNTDGYLDVIIPRIGYTVDNSIYFNDENTGHYGFETEIDNIPFPAFIKAIDADNDKDKDLLVTNKIDQTVGFRTETVIYTNNNNFVNQAPLPPSSLTSEIDSFTVILNWDKGWDKLTHNEGLSYNIRVGTAGDNADIVSPMSDLATGYRYVEAPGNAGTNTSMTLKNLPLGTYYWSVQTIDNSYTPSTWAPVQTFTLSSLTADFESDTVCLGFETHFTDISVSTHPILSWNWDFNGEGSSASENPAFRFSSSGNKSVMLIVQSEIATDTIIKNVVVKATPEAAFTNSTVCAGSATSFTNTTNLNGLTVNEWHWDFGDNSGSNIQNPGTHGYLLAGSYNAVLVAVASNGCSDTVQNDVEVGIVPTAAITLSGPPNLCSGDSVRLLNTYTESFLYSWQTGGTDITGATNNQYTAKQTGSYTVRVTNPVGNCATISPAVNVTVRESPPQPAISFSGITEFCAGDSLLLQVQDDDDLTYRWKLNGGSVGIDTSFHIAKISGTYNILVVNNDGCSSLSANSVEIKVNDKPVATSLSIPPKTDLCSGESVLLGVTPSVSYAYQWLNEGVPVDGATGNTYRAAESGRYQLEISNIKGCSIITNAINISVNPRPVRPLIDSGTYEKNMCIGEYPLKIGVRNIVEGYTYKWYMNGAPIGYEAVIEDFFEDGYYYVEADLNGCRSESDSLAMDFRESLSKPEIQAAGSSVWYLTTNSEAKYYRWYLNGTVIPGASGNIYIAGQQTGTYRVSISNDNQCFTISDTLKIPKGIVGIEDIDPFEDVRIYPNPTTGIFTIEMNNNIFGELVIDIFTQTSSKVINIKFDKTTEHFMSQIDLSGQSKGMYLVNLSLDEYRAVKKVMVE